MPAQVNNAMRHGVSEVAVKMVKCVVRARELEEHEYKHSISADSTGSSAVPHEGLLIAA